MVEKNVFEQMENLTDAVNNCAVTCIDGNEMKHQLNAYLTKIHDENSELIGGALPDDNFYYTG